MTREGNPTGEARLRGGPAWIESAAAALILAGIAVAAWRLGRDGYLPQPFYYRVHDTLMDLFTTARWANSGGAFEQWRAVYPPLSFALLRLVSTHACYAGGDVFARVCDARPRWLLLAVFAGNLALLFAIYRRAGQGPVLPRVVAVGLGLPMLYALERGNLLIPCFTAFAFGFSELVRANWPRWTALALSINFKPYLMFLALPLLAARRWGWVAGSAAAALVIYGLSAVSYGAGWPAQILANELSYSQAASRSLYADLYYATSFWPLIRLLSAHPAGLVLASPGVSAVCGVALTVVLRVAQLASLACIGAAALRPASVDVRRLAALVMVTAITGFTTGSAGYAQIFLLYLVFFEPWRGPSSIVVILGAYALCLPLDLVFLPVGHERAWSYLGGREVAAAWGVSLGQLLRPAVLLLVQFGLIALNLADTRGRATDKGLARVAAGPRNR